MIDQKFQAADETSLGIQEALSKAFDESVGVDLRGLAGLAITAPANASVAVKRFAEHVNKNRLSLLPLYNRHLDQYFVPAFPAELTVVNAQSSNGKTTFMRRWYKEHENFLIKSGQEDSYIVVIDLENTKEGIVARDFFSRHPDAVKDVLESGINMTPALVADSVSMVHGRIIYIAAPMGRPDVYKWMSVRNITALIHYITKNLFTHPIKISAIFFDYLQRLSEAQGVGQGQMNERLMADTNAIYNMGSYFGCQPVLFTQATYAPYMKSPTTYYMPGPYDIANTRAPHTLANKQIALHMPIRIHEPGSRIEHQFLGGKELKYVVTHNLQFQEIQKQRPFIPGTHNIGHKRFKSYIDFATDGLMSESEFEARNRANGRVASRNQWQVNQQTSADIPL